MPWGPVLVDASDRLYVTAGTTLRRFDFTTGKPESNALVSTPGFDVHDGLIFDREEGKQLLGVRVNTDAETTVWFQPERKKLQSLADARFPNRINRVSCRDRTASCWSSRTPTRIRAATRSTARRPASGRRSARRGAWSIRGRWRRSTSSGSRPATGSTCRSG